LSGTAAGLSIGGSAGSLSGILGTGSGGTGSSSLAGAGIPTYSASNSFTSTNGFGVSPYTGIAVFAKALSGSGAGFVGQNNGMAIPFAAASDFGGGTLFAFYSGTFPSVTSQGYIQLGGPGVIYATSSDYRLKENVAPLSNAVSKLKQLAPKRFTFISRPEAGTIDGFIAHELQAIVPQAVTGQKDEMDQTGNPKYQGIDASNLVPLLTAALQEALVRIEALEARVGA
jgi:hypothetical protein